MNNKGSSSRILRYYKNQIFICIVTKVATILIFGIY